jgi:hypothetical protein
VEGARDFLALPWSQEGWRVWIARAYLDHSAVPARLAQSGVEGIVKMEKLAEFADRPIAQGLGKTAVEAIKAMTEQNWSKL